MNKREVIEKEVYDSFDRGIETYKVIIAQKQLEVLLDIREQLERIIHPDNPL